jgi:hypothetical protein
MEREEARGRQHRDCGNQAMQRVKRGRQPSKNAREKFRSKVKQNECIAKGEKGVVKQGWQGWQRWEADKKTVQREKFNEVRQTTKQGDNGERNRPKRGRQPRETDNEAEGQQEGA